MNHRRGRARGVSLLEALVAIVVMAVGAVAVVGMQSGLRMNGDVAKQRSEAVRIAQQAIETARAYRSLTNTGADTDWTATVTSTAAAVTPPNANTEYTVTRTVQTFGTTDDDPLHRTLQVDVSWPDRTGQTQSITLNTFFGGVPVALGGSLAVSLDHSPTRRSMGRHTSIPPAAVDQGDGTSLFTPPGSSTTTWRFSNATGVITRLCEVPSPCTDIVGFLVSGYIWFATGSTQPTSADSESPAFSSVPVEVIVDQDAPYDTNRSCFEEYYPQYVAYYCLVLGNNTEPFWTGTVKIDGSTTALSTSMADNNVGNYKACRYTPVRNNTTVVGNTITVNGSTRKATNADHLFAYDSVVQSLGDQNFLMIRAGDGTTAFTCPDDNASTTKVNGSTWQHQPPT